PCGQIGNRLGHGGVALLDALGERLKGLHDAGVRLEGLDVLLLRAGTGQVVFGGLIFPLALLAAFGVTVVLGRRRDRLGRNAGQVERLALALAGHRAAVIGVIGVGVVLWTLVHLAR